MNRKRTTYNLIFGILSQVVSILLGAILPRLFLTNYGSEVNGLLSSVTQIYAYIALLEAGIGTAALQALYRTIGQSDRKGTNGVLSATNRYYKRTGCIYCGCILLFAVIYPLLIQSEIPKETIALVVVFNGLGNAVNFLFHGKYKLLLQAEGKNYIVTNLNTIIHVLTNVAKICAISMGYDVVAVQVITFVVSLAQMVYICLYIRKNYGWLDLSVQPDYKAIAQSKNVLVHQISGLVFNNTDTVILTFACGLKVVSVYSMYTLLFSMISTFLNTVTDSVTFVLGQTYHKDRERYVRYLDLYELCYMALVFALYAVAYCFILPFLGIYTRGVTDVNYIDPWLPPLFISTYLLSCGRKSANLTINFAEHFKLTQGRSMGEAVINVSVSLACVFRFGIYGVLAGTIAALFYRTNDMILYANRKILGRSPWKTYRRWIVNLGLFVGVTTGGKWILSHIILDGYFKLLLWAAVFCVAFLLLFAGAIALTERDTFQYVKGLVRSYIKRKRT